MPRSFTDTRIAVRFTSSAPADSPVRTILQRHGRLTRPPSRPVHVSALAYKCHGRLARPPSWPVHVSAPTYNAVADSLSAPAYNVVANSLSAPTYNATVDSPVGTGLPCRGRLTRERLQLHLAIINFMAHYFRPGTSGDIRLKYILLVHILFYQKSSLSLSWSAILLMQDNCSLHQNDVVNSPDRAGLQHRGRFICLSRL